MGSGIGTGSWARRRVQVLLEHLAAMRERFDARDARGVADAGSGGNANGSLPRNFNFWLNDVGLPIASAGRHITWQRKIWKRGDGDVVRAANAGFEHAA